LYITTYTCTELYWTTSTDSLQIGPIWNSVSFQSILDPGVPTPVGGFEPKKSVPAMLPKSITLLKFYILKFYIPA